MTSDIEGPTPRRGRPRSTEADAAILEATVDMLAEVGLEGLSVEQVAMRAGVGKTTIYRRYPTKIDLAMASVAWAVGPRIAEHHTGSIRDDLEGVVKHMIDALDGTRLGRLTPVMVAATHSNPEFAEAYWSFLSQRRRYTKEHLERGIADGSLRPDTDLELVADLLTGPVLMRLLVTRTALDEGLVTSLVDVVLTAFGTENVRNALPAVR